MTINQPQRHGGVTSALLALVLLVLLAAAAIFMIPGLKDRILGSEPAPISSSQPPQVISAPTRIGTVTAVRAKDGLPTFCLVASGHPLPAIGSILQINRAGKTPATLLLESVAGDQLTCRVTSWATGTQELVVGDIVEKP